MQAFDSLAADYDRAFTYTEIGRLLRGQIQARLLKHFRAGGHVLELGCGTGEDALLLAHHGIRVLATDASQAMLILARTKAGLNPLITVEPLDLRHPPLMEVVFDGAFANFGPLNCLDNWRSLAGWLAQRVKPGGIVGVGVMSPFCAWEIIWHGIHLDFETAFRRLRKRGVFRPSGASEPLLISYPTVRRLTRDFAPHFRRVHVEGIGLFLPPSDAYSVVERRPRLLRLLAGLERRLARFSALALLADHYWIEFIRE